MEVGISVKFKHSPDFPKPWPQLYEGRDRKVSQRWNVRGYPTIYILDEDGVIRKKGFMGHDEIEKTVDSLLERLEG